MRSLWISWLVMSALLAGGCTSSDAREPLLPESDSVAAWFGAGTEVRLSGNVVEIRGEIDPEYLRRGGEIWKRSGPYFYLFNVHIRDLLLAYPDLAAVRAIAVGPDGAELARAMLHRDELSEIQWKEALARASLAQTQGTDRPRLIEELIRYGEDHTEFRYAE